MMLLLLGTVLVLSAIALAAIALGGERSTGTMGRSLAMIQAMSSAPTEIQQDLERPFGERVLEPLRDRSLAIGRRLIGADAAGRIRHKLDLAGNPRDWSVDRVVSMKIMAAVVLFAVAGVFALLLGVTWPRGLVMVVVGGFIGFMAPNMYLYQASHDRSERLQRELADAVDLLTISVEAGLGFDAAIQQVARNTEGPLAEEFSRMLREMQIGAGRSEALRGVAGRSEVPELQSFVSALVQAEAFGIPIAGVLRVQSSEMRTKRRQRAEAKAQQVPVKITVPLIFFILPSLFSAVMGPAVISAMNNLAH